MHAHQIQPACGMDQIAKQTHANLSLLTQIAQQDQSASGIQPNVIMILAHSKHHLHFVLPKLNAFGPLHHLNVQLIRVRFILTQQLAELIQLAFGTEQTVSKIVVRFIKQILCVTPRVSAFGMKKPSVKLTDVQTLIQKFYVLQT